MTDQGKVDKSISRLEEIRSISNDKEREQASFEYLRDEIRDRAQAKHDRWINPSKD